MLGLLKLTLFFLSKAFKVSGVVIDPSPLSWPLYKESSEEASIANISFVLSENFLREFISFCRMIQGENTNWKQTSYNGNFRGKYAGIGMYYDQMEDKFIEVVGDEDTITR